MEVIEVDSGNPRRIIIALPLEPRRKVRQLTDTPTPAPAREPAPAKAPALDGLLLIPYPLRGWKVLFRSPATGRIYSPYTASDPDNKPWQLGEWRRAECQCRRNECTHPNEPAPAFTCACGYHAFGDRTTMFLRHRLFMSDEVIALVEATGRIILHEYGEWRAEQIRLVACWPADKWLRRVIRRKLA